MTRMKDITNYLDYLDTCTDSQFLKFCDAMEKRGYKFVTQYVHDYDYPHVTHCKDCKYCEVLTVFGVDFPACTSITPAMDVSEDDYCSKAKRRKE